MAAQTQNIFERAEPPGLEHTQGITSANVRGNGEKAFECKGAGTFRDGHGRYMQLFRQATKGWAAVG